MASRKKKIKKDSAGSDDTASMVNTCRVVGDVYNRHNKLRRQ